MVRSNLSFPYGAPIHLYLNCLARAGLRGIAGLGRHAFWLSPRGAHVLVVRVPGKA